MQDSGDPTPEGADDLGSDKPGRDSLQVGAENAESDAPEKVYDFYHQHFGVALAAGSQEVRNAEAGGRAAYAARTEVADKIGAKSESWNALKSLIRYQTSTTGAPQKDELTSSGDSFEAQWFSKSADGTKDNPAGDTSHAGDHEAVRLKWIPIVDNVPEDRWSQHENPDSDRQKDEHTTADLARQTTADVAPQTASDVAPQTASDVAPETTVDIAPQTASDEASEMMPKKAPQASSEEASTTQKSYEELLAATARGEATTPQADLSSHSLSATEKPVAKKFFGKPARMSRRPVPKPLQSADISYEEALAATARGELPVEPTEKEAETGAEIETETEIKQVEVKEVAAGEDEDHEDHEDHDDDDDDDDDDVCEHEVAEARSKFGSMNAFARMQKRTKEQVESKEEQSITGDIPEPVKDEVQAGNWDTKPASEATKEDGATVMSQWCSTSTGDSIPAIPSLDELNSIPTPSVLKDAPTQPKPFSLSTTKPTTPETDDKDVTPDSVHHTARSSWLKAASEYSSSVIKAVTEQMKMIAAKPKKTTPESPEFHTAELPDTPEDNSQL